MWSGKHNNLKHMVWEKSREEAFFVSEDWNVVFSVGLAKVHDGKQECKKTKVNWREKRSSSGKI